MIFQENGSWKLVQLFAEKPAEETEILEAFSRRLSVSSPLIHFNGTTFDIPYLQHRCDFHGLPLSWPDSPGSISTAGSVLFRNFWIFPSAARKTVRFLRYFPERSLLGRSAYGSLPFLSGNRRNTPEKSAAAPQPGRYGRHGKNPSSSQLLFAERRAVST